MDDKEIEMIKEYVKAKATQEQAQSTKWDSSGTGNVFGNPYQLVGNPYQLQDPYQLGQDPYQLGQGIGQMAASSSISGYPISGYVEEFKNLCNFCKKLFELYVKNDDEKMKDIVREEIERLKNIKHD